jgi:hypothetical protein
MVQRVKTMVDLYLEWVVSQADVRNVFNFVFQATIFQKLRSSTGTLD